MGKAEEISLAKLQEENRQLQKDLLAERVLRIDIQMQLLGIMRQEAATKFQELQGEAEPKTLS
ncbi:MAG TPA: hypothetical protein VIN67_03030 [Desulfobaccales bacterium]